MTTQTGAVAKNHDDTYVEKECRQRPGNSFCNFRNAVWQEDVRSSHALFLICLNYA